MNYSEIMRARRRDPVGHPRTRPVLVVKRVEHNDLARRSIWPTVITSVGAGLGIGLVQALFQALR